MLNDNENIKKWLALILFERFGHNFIINSTDNKYDISLEDSSSKIIFDEIIPEFYEFGSGLNLPCSNWNGKEEGFKFPIEENIPAPGKKNIQTPLIEFKDKNAYIHYDILGLIYWMLNRIEEIGRQDLDEHERFPATSSHAYKHGYLERPIVDEWLFVLAQVIKRVWPGIKLKEHKFDIKVSHDVDSASLYGFKNFFNVLKTMGGDVIKRKDIKSALLGPWIRLNTSSRIHPLDPHNTFDFIMDISEKNNIKSAFYFICGKTDKTKDADYNINHPAIINLMKHIHERGHEIGLHPSYNTFNNPDLIFKEADTLKKICSQEKINQETWGGRMHYLRWKHPDTMLAWEKAGMSYDSTLSYADHAGFRCGTCFEYPAFDPVNYKILNLRIRPLIAMDCSVTSERYMNLGYVEKALKKFFELKEKCRLVNGNYTLLWHNTELQKNKNKFLYTKI